MEKFVIMLRSAASPKAGEIIRDLVHQDVLGPLSELIAGDEADLRANMLLAILMGSGVLRTVMKVDAFDGSETPRIACGERFRCLLEAALSCSPCTHAHAGTRGYALSRAVLTPTLSAPPTPFLHSAL